MSQAAEIQAVVFDLDGLIFNTEDLYDLVSDEILQPFGERFSHDVKRKMMGLPGTKALAIMIEHYSLNTTPDYLQQQCDLVFERILPTELALMPGAHEFLDSVAEKKLPCGVATSSRRGFLERTLSQFDLLSRFEFTLSAEDVENGKPNPEIYLTAAGKLGVLPAQMLVLEDSENGCRAAVAAGAHAVAVPNRHTAEHDFTGAKKIANTLADPYLYELIGCA